MLCFSDNRKALTDLMLSSLGESFFNCGEKVSDIQGIFSETEDALGPEFRISILIRFYSF